MSIPKSFTQDLLNRADIVDVVGRHVTLKKAGSNFVGLCPFHGEKSPSFSVSPIKQFYHCFGCGKSGDAISFLMAHTNASFVEAVHDLASQFGLVVPQEKADPQEQIRSATRKAKQVTLTEVLESAARFYQEQLRSSDLAKNYLKGRGVSGEIAKTYGIGYAPEGWQSLGAAFSDYADPILVEAGLVVEQKEESTQMPASAIKRYDRFRQRVIFPIRSIKGECIGFGARVLDKSLPKYLNSPETPVFSKGQELYGLYEARAAIRDKGYCLVTEGYMDVIALAQLGFANCVATLGTACTTEHMQKLFRVTDAVVFSFDGDKAGLNAAKKALAIAIPFATDTRSLKFLFLPQEHDPDSFIRAHGAESFEKHVLNAVALSRFLIEVACQECDLSSAEGRAKMSALANPLWSALPEGVLKQQLITQIAEKTQISAYDLLTLWRKRQQTASIYRTPMRREGGKSILRTTPLSRADWAMRILFSNNAAWENLSAQEHQMLCELPAPYGEIFTWLDQQYTEHGAQNWAALVVAIHEKTFAPFVMKHMQASLESGSEFSAAELRSVINMQKKEIIKLEEEKTLQLIIKSPENKGLRDRYEELKAQRLAL